MASLRLFPFRPTDGSRVPPVLRSRTAVSHQHRLCVCVCVAAAAAPHRPLSERRCSLSAALSPSASAQERGVTGEEKRQRPNLQRSLVPVIDIRGRGGHVAVRANSAGATRRRYNEKAPSAIELLNAAPYAYLARFVSQIIGFSRSEHIHAFISAHTHIYIYFCKYQRRIETRQECLSLPQINFLTLQSPLETFHCACLASTPSTPPTSTTLKGPRYLAYFQSRQVKKNDKNNKKSFMSNPLSADVTAK